MNKKTSSDNSNDLSRKIEVEYSESDPTFVPSKHTVIDPPNHRDRAFNEIIIAITKQDTYICVSNVPARIFLLEFNPHSEIRFRGDTYDLVGEWDIGEVNPTKFEAIREEFDEIDRQRLEEATKDLTERYMEITAAIERAERTRMSLDKDIEAISAKIKNLRQYDSGNQSVLKQQT